MQYIYKITNTKNNQVYIVLKDELIGKSFNQFANKSSNLCMVIKTLEDIAKKNGETQKRIEQFRAELQEEPVYIA